MLNPEIWIQGGTTMLVGMGIVFSFLVILVFAIGILSKVVGYLNKICPIAQIEAKTTKKVATDDSEVALAIVLASRGV